MPTDKLTIPNAASITATINLRDKILVGLQMPAAWTAAELTFQVSADSDGATFANLYDQDGNEVVYQAAVDRYIQFTPSDWVGINFLRIRSGRLAAPINQLASRELKLVTAF